MAVPADEVFLAVVECLWARNDIRYCIREEAVLSEYVQFAVAMILFVGTLIGSYSFVLTSSSVREPLSTGLRNGEK